MNNNNKKTQENLANIFCVCSCVHKHVGYRCTCGCQRSIFGVFFNYSPTYIFLVLLLFHAGDLNSGSYAYTDSSLQTEPPL